MKKITILCVAMCTVISAAAQEKNRNLIYRPQSHYEAGVKAVTFNGTEYGAVAGFRYQGRLVGGEVEFGSTTTTDWTAASFADLLVGMRFGNKVRFGFDGGAGIGQIWETNNYEFKTWAHDYQISIWRPLVLGRANIDFRIGESVILSLYGGYRHFFYTESQHEQKADNWQLVSQKATPNQWFAGLGLSFDLGDGGRISGDNCWLTSTFAGWSNKGWFAGAGLEQVRRIDALWGRTLGFGTQYTLCEGDAEWLNRTINEVYAQAGIQYLPAGAKSPIVVDLYGTFGIGQACKELHCKTESEILKFDSSVHPFGVNAKANVGVCFHRGPFSLGGYGFVGYAVNAETTISGVDGYTGTQSENHGLLYGAFAKVALRF